MKKSNIVLAFSFLLLVSAVVVYAQTSGKGIIRVGNAAPSVTSATPYSRNTGVISSTSKPTNETDYVNFSVSWTDPNTDPVSIFVCDTSSATTSGCTGTTIASSSSSIINPRYLIYTTLITDPEVNPAFVFVSDGLLLSTEASGDQTFYINHKPFASSVTTGPASPTETSTLTCTYSFNDPDVGDTERVANALFQWYIKNEGIGTFTIIAGQSAGTLSNTNFDKADVLNCRTKVTDNHGLPDDIFVNSTNFVTIGNTAPNAATALLVQDGSAPNYDTGLVAYDGTGGYDTHMRTPRIRWTKGTDIDADAVTTYLCLSTTLGGCNLAGIKTSFSEYNVTTGLLNYIGSSRTYYLNLTANDGTANSSRYTRFFNLTNDIPTAPSALSPTSTHDSTPLIDWANSVDADTAGTIDNFPADTLTYVYSTGTTGAGSTNLVNTTAPSSTFQHISAIPWSTDGQAAGWNNETVFTRIYALDGNNNGRSSNYDTTFVLYDYLPDIIQVQITTSGSLYTDQALNPTAHANASAAIRIRANDRDGDCNTGHIVFAGLCDNSTVATCTEANSQYRFQLSRVTLAGGNDCFYERLVNSSIGTPEFWKDPGTWKLRGNITETIAVGSGNQRTTDTEKNANFIYNELNAINYPTTLYLGDAVIDLGSFNTNTTPSIVENWGNIDLNLSWRVTDPISQNDYWNLSVEGDDDFLIDDDADVALDTSNLAFVQLIYTNKFFHPANGLNNCNSNACNSLVLNETLNTLYHIRPPIGLLPGLYNNTITITRVKH